MTAVTASSEENDNSKIGTRRWLLLGISFLTSTLYAMTLLVVSVILPQIQGSLSATPDQIAWTVTFNILATAIVTPISGWLAGRFGARFPCWLRGRAPPRVGATGARGEQAAPPMPVRQPLGFCRDEAITLHVLSVCLGVLSQSPLCP